VSRPKGNLQPTPLATRLGRWALALLVLGVMVGGGAWGTLWLLTPQNVPLEKVRIDGEIRHTRREVLQHTLAGRISGSFFSLDLDGVRTAVEELPWVTEASVRRVWPNTLLVQVHEREALARWGERGVVSPEGEVFIPDPGTVPGGLARLAGPDGSAEEVVEKYKWARERAAGGGFGITRLELSERHAWRLELEGEMDVHLGNRDADARFERVLAHLPRLREDGAVQRIDARYANGFAVQWRPGQEPPSAQAAAEE